MHRRDDFNRKQLEALHRYFDRVKRSRQGNVTMSDVVISWFTDGHAERFRNEYLKNHTIFS
ncbi:MAG: hypothetical protein Kow0037_11940 [Calditrichia bacterium]